MILSVILLLNVVSAEDVSFSPDNNYSVTLKHGESDTYSFEIVNNNDSYNLTNISFDISNFNGDPEFNVTLDASIIENNSDETAIIGISVPEYTSSGNYTGEFSVIGNLSNSEEATSETFTINLEVESSPSLTLSITQQLSTTENGTVVVENTGNTALNNIELVSVGTADFTVDFNDSGFDLGAGTTRTLALLSSDAKNIEIGDDNTLNIKATSNEDNSTSKEVKVQGVSFCSEDNPGELSVSNFDFEVTEGFGDEDDYWYPLDTVEVEFDVDNDGKYDIESIEIEMCLMDEDGECIFDEDDMDLSEDDFDLDEGDDITITATFDVDPDELTQGNEDYTLYVKAQGNIDDNDAEDENLDGNATCDSSSEENLEIRQEEFIIIDDARFSETVQCGTEMEVVVDVWNVDDSDMDEDDVYFLIYNRELGITRSIDATDDLDALDNTELRFTVDIPEDAEEKTYGLEVRVYDDEDRNSDDLYENSEDDEAIYTLIFEVSRCRLSVLNFFFCFFAFFFFQAEDGIRDT